jgi:hypothetical protein
MTTNALPTRYRRTKMALAVLVAIVGFPIVIIALLASVSGGRR